MCRIFGRSKRNNQLKFQSIFFHETTAPDSYGIVNKIVFLPLPTLEGLWGQKYAPALMNIGSQIFYPESPLGVPPQKAAVATIDRSRT